MAVAQNVMTIVPTMAGYMPPPGWRLMIGMSSVRKLQSIDLQALLHDVAEDEDERHDREQDRPDHPGVASPLRMRRRGEMLGSRIHEGCSGATTLTAPPSRLDSHRLTLSAARAMTFTRIVMTNSTTPRPMSAARCIPDASPNSFAMTAAIVSPDENTCVVICRARTDRQRHGDRLAHRPAEAEHDRADDAGTHTREHRDAQHLPAGRAHAERGVLVVLRDRRERFAS